MPTLTAAQARQRAGDLRERATKESSANLRYELKQLAEHYDELAVELERVELGRA